MRSKIRDGKRREVKGAGRERGEQGKIEKDRWNEKRIAKELRKVGRTG